MPVLRHRRKECPPEDGSKAIEFREYIHIAETPTMVILGRKYRIGEMIFEHICKIDFIVYNSLRPRETMQLGILDAFETVFWTFIEWDINPHDCETKLVYLESPDPFDPLELTLEVIIPRRPNQDWLKFWSQLEQQIYRHILSKELGIVVERY